MAAVKFYLAMVYSSKLVFLSFSSQPQIRAAIINSVQYEVMIANFKAII
jgi:hypothetical protein